MNLVKILKQNYHIYKIGREIRILLTVIKNNITFKKFKIRKNNINNGTLIPSLGYIKISLNESIDYEKKLLFDESEEMNWLHSIKMLLTKDSKVVFYYPEGLLIPIFLAQNIGCTIFMILKKENKIINKAILENNLENIHILHNDTNMQNCDLAFLNDIDILIDKNFKQIITHRNIQYDNIDKQYSVYKNISGRYFHAKKILESSLSIDFHLLTKKQINTVNIILSQEKNKITGGTYLRSPEIYPFDLCYDSILDNVDEFIFAIDDVLQVDTDMEHKKRDHLIEKFMDDLDEHQRKKINIVKFDFKARFNKKLSVPAKWLVDVSNHILDISKYDNICFIQADEMYHESNFDEIRNFARQDINIALWHEFLHFIGDLEHIRNPKTVAYTHAIRVFKKDRFSCTGDGYSFISLLGKNYLPKITISKYPIYHFGYVIDFRKKIQTHLDDGGIFDFKHNKVSIDKWIDNADLVKYSGDYPKSLFLKNRLSSDKVLPLLKNLI